MKKNADALKLEYDVAETLGKHGFWAHVCAKGRDGSQPCDIIAINHRGKHLIDAKLCSGKRFVLDRMEDNQLNSMKWFKKRCGGHGWFAISIGGQVYMMDGEYLEMLQTLGEKSISRFSEEDRLENWINAFKDQ